jgi:nucleotide-binding universal stress UspA family protein
MKTDKILIVADDSPSAIQAINYGFSLARELKADVTLLSVIEPAKAEGNVDAGIFPDDEEKKLKRAAKNFLIRAKKQHGHNVNTILLTPEGEINAVVINTAKEWGAKLIITGTHGRTGLSKLLNSSVSESIIHNSSIPVCVVPMEK